MLARAASSSWPRLPDGGPARSGRSSSASAPISRQAGPRRDDAFARSPGCRVAFGSYESVQVNVDALGNNIVGDAGQRALHRREPAESGRAW